MKAGNNKELDYLLINLIQQPQKPDHSQAEKYREKYSISKQPWTCTKTEEYHIYGTGVSLYFKLLKYLVGLFFCLAVLSIPSLVVNYNGDGLELYGNSLGRSMMRFSLANQPSLSFEKDELTKEQYQQKQNKIKMNQFLIISNDVVCTTFMMAFVIFWLLKSEDLIGQMVKKQALPSYHTILVQLQNPEITQEDVREHFQKFGDIRQVEFIYNYDNFLLEVKDFLALIERYSEQVDENKRGQMYNQIGEDYQKIKDVYHSAAQHNMTRHQHPFKPTMAFVCLESPQLAYRVVAAYKYKLEGIDLKIKGQKVKVQNCNVEPMSIMWENFHLPACSQIKRSWLFGILVTCILLITLFGIFLMSLHTWQQAEYSGEMSSLGTVSYQTALNTKNPRIVNQFCSKLTYQTFQWKYYELCAAYFSNFEHHWAFVLTVSGVIVGINLFLIKIVFALAELRRFRTLPEKKIFLTLSIFLTYFFSSSVLAILIRGQLKIGDSTFSLVEVAQLLFSSTPAVEVYNQATRKWYLHIGKLLMVNYILTLNICPWLYVVEEWISKQVRKIWSRMAKTQRQAKERLIDLQFYWQFYYAVELNAIFFCLIFSMAMPMLYFLAFISMASLFLSSKIIFHSFTREPQVFDHKMNSFMLRAICLAIFLHVYSSSYFVSVEDIFPEKEGQMITRNIKHIVYYSLAAIVLVVTLIPKRIASLVRKKTSVNNSQLMITEQINSSFGARSNGIRMVAPKKEKKKQRIPLMRELRRDSYLNSYKMQDNIYYNNISYTLLILYQTIVECKEPDIEKSAYELRSEESRVSQMKQIEKMHQSMNHYQTNRHTEQDIYHTDRALNLSI